MVWFNNNLLVFSLTFFRYAQAVPCSSGLLSCFAIVGGTYYDYELVYNQIPRNSLNSICRKMSSTFPKASLSPPGCSTLQRAGFSNLITISTRDWSPGHATTARFIEVKNAFSRALECDSQEFASCQFVNTSASVFSNSQTTVPMSQPGDTIHFVGYNSLILSNLGSSNTPIKFVDSTSSNIANAMQMISMQLDNQTSAYIILSSPIDQATNLVVVVDLGIGDETFSPAEIGIGSGSWLVLLQGLVAAGISSNTGSIAGTYSQSYISYVDFLYISVSIEQ